tara:strand:- start:1 stop:456 length:456 start_codon:yes stop_codon:yes gene_type:complete
MLIATKSDIIDLSSEKKTEELAEKISKKLKLGDIIFLYGEMGVGKTTFLKYLINKFQKKHKINQTEVTSPTFNIVNEYQINETKIYHYDLFRLKSIDEVKNLDLFSDREKSIIAVEWPQIIKEKPKNLIEFIFKYEENYEKRSVEVKGLDF